MLRTHSKLKSESKSESESKPKTHSNITHKSSQKSPKSPKKPKFSLKSSKSTQKTAESTKPIKSTKSSKSKASLHRPFDLYSRESLEKTLKIDAKALKIPSGAADIFIKKTLDAVEKSLKPKQIITEHDLTVEIVKELKKYHPDFAYVYQNRDKIV